MVSKSFITLKHVDTSTAAQNFSDLLNKEGNKTYFLNGKWGSGKTEFLNEAQKHINKKLVTIDFWKLKDDRTAIELAFSKLHPFMYWGIRFGAVLAVVVSILMTNVVDLGIGRYFSDNWIKVFGSFIVLIVAVYQFFKIKSDGFYAWLLTKIPCKNKILIIDDFDRISNNRQKESYKLFALLDRKLSIIFVGDINNIAFNGNNYLSKIIDRRVELPFVLHSNNIWDEYFTILEKQLNAPISLKFKNLAKGELRNLRDREHFNDYVNQEFFKRGKLGHVQVEEQLLVIYAYLFHIDIYQGLVDNTIKNVEALYSREENKNSNMSTTLANLFSSQSNKQSVLNEVYPYPYLKNKSAYFIYEEASNSTVNQLEDIFLSEDRLERAMLSDRNTDFYQYFVAKYASFSEERKEQLFTLVLQYSRKYINSAVISYIVGEKKKEIEQASEGSEQRYNEIYNRWNRILDEASFDFSQQLYFLENNHIFSFHDLGLRFPNIDISGAEYDEYDRKDFALLTYLASKDLWKEDGFNQWPDKLWKKINGLPNQQFLAFWIMQKIISNGKNVDTDFDYIPENKTYILWIKKYSFDVYKQLNDYRKTVIEKIEPKLNELEQAGYSFDKKIDETCKWDD
ncbi:KAP family NTPase [Streptococcus mutans]|nr:KAP family NTPase [Streptococcus mutans]MCB5118482.1 KAP family NTPase [Streptococcus mutans]